MKRLLAILLALVIILGLAACAKAPEEVSGAAPEAETTNTAEEAQEAEELPDGVISTDSAKLRVMLNTSSPDRALLASEWYPKYKEAFPNFDVEFDLQSTGYPDKLAVACAGGDIPDVFWCFNSTPIETGSALDLTDLIAEDGFLNNYKIADPLRPYSDGRIYSLQTGADNYYLPTIWYNKTIFEEVGVEVPETYGEFLDVCEKIKAAGYIPVAMTSTWPFELRMQELSITIDPEAMLKVINKEMSWNDPTMLATVKKFQTLLENGVFSEDVGTLSWDGACELFNSEAAAMWMEPTWGLGSITLDQEKIDFFMMPTDSGEKNILGYGSYGTGYCVSSETEQTKQALMLAEWITKQDAIYFEQQGNSVSYNTGLETEVSELMAKHNAIFENPEYHISMDVASFWGAEAAAVYQEQCSLMMAGEISAEEFCANMAEVWN